MQTLKAKYFIEVAKKELDNKKIMEITGMNPMRLSRIERGIIEKIDIDTVAALAKGLNLTIDELHEKAVILRSTGVK